jgi:hypothetical protein
MSEDKDLQRVAILHACSEHTIVGEEDGTVRVLHPTTEGQAIPAGSRVVDFQDRGEPGFMDMRTLYRTPGPAKVNSRQYKSGWDAVFGKRAVNSGELN